MLTRADFCKLVELEPEALKTLARRRQLPFEIDQGKHGRGYTLFEAFLTVLWKTWTERTGVGLGWAADDVSNLAPMLSNRWPDIWRTAASLYGGGKVLDEIVCGTVDIYAIGKVPICGTVPELADWLKDHQPVIQVTWITATRSLANLMLRAGRSKIELPEDAPEPQFRPQTPLVSLADNMRRLINEGRIKPMSPDEEP